MASPDPNGLQVVQNTPSQASELEETKESSPADADGEDLSEEIYHPSLPEVLVSYLSTEKGHAIATRAMDLLEGVRKATLDERVNARAVQAEIQKLSIRRSWWLKTIGLFVVTAAIVGLSVIDKLTPASGTILGAIAGYLFSQSRPNS